MVSFINPLKKWWFLPALLSMGGCSFLAAPEPEPVPSTITGAEKKAPKGPVFTVGEGVKHWDDPIAKMNDPKDPQKKKPAAFVVTDVISGDFIKAAPVKIETIGKPPKEVRTVQPADTMHLAGIIAPRPGEPGWADTVAKVKEWVLNRDVDIERDPVYMTDIDNRPLVQVFFQPATGKLKGQTLCLNRMLVRLGLAWVDINSPTSADVKPWLNDEEFARSHKEPDAKSPGGMKFVSIGLWAKGIYPLGRVAAPTPIGAHVVTHQIAAGQPTAKTAAKTVSTKNVRIRSTTTTTNPGGTTSGAGYPGSTSGYNTSGTSGSTSGYGGSTSGTSGSTSGYNTSGSRGSTSGYSTSGSR